jgi:hypothetical protein
MSTSVDGGGSWPARLWMRESDMRPGLFSVV